MFFRQNRKWGSILGGLGHPGFCRNNILALFHLESPSGLKPDFVRIKYTYVKQNGAICLPLLANAFCFFLRSASFSRPTVAFSLIQWRGVWIGESSPAVCNLKKAIDINRRNGCVGRSHATGLANIHISIVEDTITGMESRIIISFIERNADIIPSAEGQWNAA